MNHKKYTESEEQAEKDLSKIYREVTRSPYNRFYNFLVRKGTLPIRIEVKWSKFSYNCAYVEFRWSQFWRLLGSRNFLIYMMTDKGNIFIKPRTLLNKAHVHFYELNKNMFKIMLKVQLIDQKIKVVEPEHCKFCKGTVKQWLLAQ